MTDRAEAFILKTKAGQWMVEVWSGGDPVQCVAGLQTEMDAVEEASNLAGEYGDMEFVIIQGRERPSL